MLNRSFIFALAALAAFGSAALIPIKASATIIVIGTGHNIVGSDHHGPNVPKRPGRGGHQPNTPRRR
jgi:hypothetical protein